MINSSEENHLNNSQQSDKRKTNRPSIDLNLINSSETGRIFSASVANSFLYNSVSENKNLESEKVEKSNAKVTLPNEDAYNSLSISPKSAFVKMIKK